MTPRRENSHIEYRSMLRIVSFVILFKALMSLDIFISYISEIMVIFNVKKKILLIFFLFGPNYLRKIHSDPLFSFWISTALGTSNKSHMGTTRKKYLPVTGTHGMKRTRLLQFPCQIFKMAA